MTLLLCERCGQPLGAPHLPLPSDCVMSHADPHIEGYVGYLCRRHYGWVDRTLAEILELFALLPDVIVPGPGGDTRSGTRVGSPAPGRVEVMALTDPRGIHEWIDDPDAIPDLPGALALWLRVMAEDRPEWSKHGLDNWDGTLASTVRILRKERNWLAQQPWVDDYANELSDLHRAVARGVGDTMWPRPVGKCPNCTRPMFITVGVDEISCKGCHSVWTGTALARLRLIHEQEAQ